MSSPNSVKLFTAWAAKHKQVLQLEDLWNVAARNGHPHADALQTELVAAREEAQHMLAEAQRTFHEELKARGIRE